MRSIKYLNLALSVFVISLMLNQGCSADETLDEISQSRLWFARRFHGGNEPTDAVAVVTTEVAAAGEDYGGDSPRIVNERGPHPPPDWHHLTVPSPSPDCLVITSRYGIIEATEVVGGVG